MKVISNRPRTWDLLLAWVDAFGPLALLGAVTGVVAFAYLGVFTGEPCGDDNSFHLAEIVRLAEAFRHGDLDAWNPGANGGYASGYYYQVVAQAFPAALSALTGLSALTCFQLGIFVPLVAAPGLAFRAVRVAGGSPWQAVGAAIALPFALGASRWGHGADGLFTVGLYTQLWAFVALPLAFAHAVRYADEGRDLASALAWGLFCGLAHPFAGIALGLAVIAGLPWVWATDPPLRWWAPLRTLALGALLVIGSACAWLPVIVDHDGFGGFPHRVPDEVGPGFLKLGRWLVDGQVLDSGRTVAELHLPLLTALLPVAALFGRAPWMARWWSAAIAFALLLGVGPYLGKTGPDDLLPAVRFWGALQIVLAILAGAGTVAAIERVWQLRLRDPWRPMLCAAAATLGVIVAVVHVGSGLAEQQPRVKVATDYPKIARAGLDPVLAALRELPPGRTQVRAGAENHWAIMLPYIYTNHPAFLAMGGAGLQSSPSFVYTWEVRERDPRRAAWIFNAPYVIARADRARELTGAEPLAASADYALLRYPAPGLVGPVLVAGELPRGRDAERKAGVGWLWSVLPYGHVVFAQPGTGVVGALPHGRVTAAARAGSSIHAEVEVDDGLATPTTFVVRETWHPRWRATVDGAPATIRRVTPAFMAIDVPPGAHTIVLQFERPQWALLLWLLWPALPLFAAIGDWIATAMQRRRAASA